MEWARKQYDLQDLHKVKPGKNSGIIRWADRQAGRPAGGQTDRRTKNPTVTQSTRLDISAVPEGADVLGGSWRATGLQSTLES